MFKQLIQDNVRGAIRVFRDDGKQVVVDTNKKNAAKGNNMSNIIGLLLLATLFAMCTHEPMLHCSDSPDFPTNDCEEAEAYKSTYSVFTMCSMAVHWLVIIDLSVFSTELSAFLLVIGHVLHEVQQFLIALTFLLLMFASSISILCRNCTEEGGYFGTIEEATITLFAIAVRLYQGDFRDMTSDPLLLTTVMVCTTFSAVLLLNLLVAQLNLSYEYIYRDMQGFARLNRASLICDAMNLCSKGRWTKFKESMHLDKKLEFDEGDVGLAGGVQVLEPASAHRTSEEQIIRFGGTTSPQAPWPAIAHAGGFDDRLQRLERMLKKAVKLSIGKVRKSSKTAPGKRHIEAERDDDASSVTWSNGDEQ